MRIAPLLWIAAILSACPSTTSATSSSGGTTSTSTGRGTAGSSTSGSATSGTAGGCRTDTDCPSLITLCQNGSCVPNICPADAGLYGTCDAAGAWDGTCVPEIAAQIFAGCQQGGTATTACDPAGTRADLALVCGAGSLCRAGPDGGECGLVCEAETGLPCGPGEVCLTDGLVGNAGFCFATGDGGCVLDLPGATELSVCQSSSACGCPMACSLNLGTDAFACELPCAQTSDCPTATTVCAGGRCAPSYCSFDPLDRPAGDAGFGDLCNAEASGDGVCAPAYVFDEDGSLTFVYGLCRQGGALSIGAACEPSGLRDGGLCGTAALCVGTGDGGDVCAAICSPADGGPCLASQGCFTAIPPPFSQSVGVCLPCSAAGATCLNGGECCSGECVADGGVCS